MNKSGGCFDSDIMKAFDWAIHDRVDVVSVSLGGQPDDYFNDDIAIRAFHAVKKGMAVVCSAGNDGPSSATVTNVAPWILTVGASTIFRQFPSYVKLKNGKHIKGESLSKPLPQNKFYPLINSADAKAAHASAKKALLCEAGAPDPEKVKGKIVVCFRGEIARVEKSQNAYHAGAVGMILCNDKADADKIVVDHHIIPASSMSI